MESMMKNDYKTGLWAAIISSSLWGVLPVYWKLLLPIPSTVIIFYRIFLVGLVSFLVSYKKYGISYIGKIMGKPGIKSSFFFIGLIITFNWSIYIWAVNNGYILQTSIGYYIEPLFLCLFGIIFFGELPTLYNKTAMLLACIGLFILVLNYGQIPYVALIIGVSFAVYAALKKKFKIDAIISLFLETMFLMPISLGIVIYLEISGRGAFHYGSLFQFGLLLLSGVMTALPLGLFALGANKLPMITLGITSYISPSLALILGVVFYHEPFDLVSFISFGIVWIGLFIFTLGEYKNKKNM